jgi:TolA-binding protein
MAKNTIKKESEYELLENPDALAERLNRSEDFIKENRNVLLGVFALIAAVIVGGFLYYNHRTSRNAEAQAQMFQAIYYYEADSLNKALAGDGQYPGLTQIADEYSGTDAGNLANYYAGVAFLKLGQYQEAINHLEDFNSNDFLLQARAYSLLGDAQMELGNHGAAADLYRKAANHNANEHFSPQYLMKAAIASEAQNNFKAAVGDYDRIINDFPNTPDVNDARKYRARAEVLAGN